MAVTITANRQPTSPFFLSLSAKNKNSGVFTRYPSLQTTKLHCRNKPTVWLKTRGPDIVCDRVLLGHRMSNLGFSFQTEGYLVFSVKNDRGYPRFCSSNRGLPRLSCWKRVFPRYWSLNRGCPRCQIESLAYRVCISCQFLSRVLTLVSQIRWVIQQSFSGQHSPGRS